MKTIILLLSFGLCLNVQANRYYFSVETGNDLRSSLQAQSPLTPWKTLNKLNSFFKNLNAGDSILFHSGEIFEGPIIIARSGTRDHNIVLSSYGSGPRPIISGFTSLSLWTYSGNGVYQSNCAGCKVTDQMLTIDDFQQPIGRYPNSGYLLYEGYTGNNMITDKQLTESPNWTGADIVVRKSHWTLERNKITAHSGNHITFDSHSNSSPTVNYGYFIQNDVKTLDKLGEWFFRDVDKTIMVYFGNNQPQSYKVKTSIIDTLITISYKNYITFANLAFEGSNISAFDILASNNINIQNCSINFSGANAITAWSSPDLKIEHSNINHTNNNAIGLYWGGTTNTSIRYDTIKNTGLMAGLGSNDDNSYDAIVTTCAGTIVEYNDLDSIGHSGVRFLSDSVVIKNNLIAHFALTRDDAGGVYVSQRPTDPIYYGRKITGNIISNGIGASEGTEGYLATEGIYIDAWVKNVEIVSNTVFNCAHSGIFLQSAQGIYLNSNQVFNNSYQLLMNNAEPSRPLKNLTVKKNTFFSKLAFQKVLGFITSKDDISAFGNADSNKYVRPFGDNYSFTTSSPLDTWVEIPKNLFQWQREFKKDLNSKVAPKKIPDFKLVSLVGATKFNNGSFKSDISGLYCWSATGNSSVSWDASGKIDGGGLKVSRVKMSGDDGFVIVGIGEILKTKHYILRFTVRGSKPGTVGAYLKQSNTPFNDITSTNFYPTANGKLDFEVLLTPNFSEKNASVVFKTNDLDSIVWLDNINLYEANVTLNNPDDYLRFEVNTTNVQKIVQLDQQYIDSDSTFYEKNLILKPYTSKILIKGNIDASIQKRTSIVSGKKIDNQIAITSQLTNQGGTLFYEIQKSTDGDDFYSIDVVPSMLNATESTHFLRDSHPSYGSNYYRIKEVGLMGETYYSNTLFVEYSFTPTLSIGPNPTGNVLKVSYSLPNDISSANLSIQNISGLTYKNITLNNTSQTIVVDISNLTTGTYVMVLAYKNFIVSKKFIKSL